MFSNEKVMCRVDWFLQEYRVQKKEHCYFTLKKKR